MKVRQKNSYFKQLYFFQKSTNQNILIVNLIYYYDIRMNQIKLFISGKEVILESRNIEWQQFFLSIARVCVIQNYVQQLQDYNQNLFDSGKKMYYFIKMYTFNKLYQIWYRVIQSQQTFRQFNKFKMIQMFLNHIIDIQNLGNTGDSEQQNGYRKLLLLIRMLCSFGNGIGFFQQRIYQI
ncbi:unnamed protein product [Paramecium octaurelia]|uniref:Uncharacterized protein n=1 Tax=Paramecium octaurelia TaxID=43137 RepID=A0A8S1VQJ5_PAROT|nr:unnamed protein product [Paramecium octaurelia]